MTKEELIKRELGRYALRPEHVYHGTNAIPAAFHKAMDEYAKQQSIAFFRFFLPGPDDFEPYISKRYEQFIEQQNKDNG